MAKIPGTNVASTIAPFTTDDQFPTHDAIYGKGGQREVATIAERDAIPSARLTEGCTCYVAATEKTYRWKSNAWVDDTPEIASDASDISYTPSGSSTPTNVATALDSLNQSVNNLDIPSDASDIDYTPSGSGSTPTTVAGALDGLEDSVQDNADDIADLQEGAVAVDVDTTTKVFAIKNAKGQDVGTITVSETTGLPATLTLAKAGTNGQSITVSLPTLAYNSQTQMLEYVDATGTHVPTIKLSNLQIKYVGSTDPSTGTWALGDLILVGSNRSYELKVYDGNSTWQSLSSINNVSLQADQVHYDDANTQWGDVSYVQDAIEKLSTTDGIKVAGEQKTLTAKILDFLENVGSTDNSELNVCDEYGYVVLRIKNGHIITSNFNSSDLNHKPLKGKTVAFLGDSITEGIGTIHHSANIDVTKRYSYVFCQMEECAEVNLGVRSTCLAANTSNGLSGQRFITRATFANLSSADLIFVFGGTNDFSYDSVPIGESFVFEDISPTDRIGSKKKTPNQNSNSFAGALHELILQIRAVAPQAQLVFITPLNRGRYMSGRPTSAECNVHGEYIQDFRKTIMEICDFYAIPVVPLHTLMNQDWVNDTENSTSIFDDDGIHPNVDGHARIAKILYNWVESNIVF